MELMTVAAAFTTVSAASAAAAAKAAPSAAALPSQPSAVSATAATAARAGWGAELVGLHARMLRSDRKWYHVLVEDFEPREALHLLRFFSMGAPTASRAYYSLRDADRRVRWHDERGALMAEGQPPRAAAKGVAPAPAPAGTAESRRSSADAAGGGGGGGGGGAGGGGGVDGAGARPLPSIPLVAVRVNVLESGATAPGSMGSGGSVPPSLPPPPPPHAAAPSVPAPGPSTAPSSSARRAIFRQPNGAFFAYTAGGAAVRVILPQTASNRATPTPLEPPAGGWGALQERADDPQRLLFRRVRIYWPLVSFCSVRACARAAQRTRSARAARARLRAHRPLCALHCSRTSELTRAALPLHVPPDDASRAGLRLVLRPGH